MRLRPPGPPRRPFRPRWTRTLLVVSFAWAVVVASGVGPLGFGGAPPAHADTGVTVTGPPVWQPGDGTYGPEGSVTVSPATGLGNQVVRVSWRGFTPTVDVFGSPVAVVRNPHDGSADSNAVYPVRVYQCRGLQPAVTDCYGSTLYGGDPAKGFRQAAPEAGLTTPEFPSNMAIGATRPDGTGEVAVEVWTSQQSQSLGCDADTPCSIVVEPEYGGDALGAYQDPLGTVNCAEHAGDNDFFFNEATDASLFIENLGHPWRSGEACAWEHRTVVPLTFAPSAADCESRAADFSAIGLEMATRAMQQWRAGLCHGQDPLNVQYTFGGGEPQARSGFLRRSGADVALTARPDRGPAPRPYVYAPLAVTSISVVYVVDDAETHRQIRRLRLNARLVAKMLTQSYRLNGEDTVESVAGNPACIFDDPEFRSLNPSTPGEGPNWPSCVVTGDFRATSPVVVGGTTDLVHQVTSWLAADPEAGQFLQGAEDPWGMHLDTFYLRPAYPGYPVEALQPQDFSGPQSWKQYEWNPVLGGLGEVARHAMQSQPSCLSTDVTATGGHNKCQVQTVGARSFFAVLDSGDAQALSLPEAELRNPAGSFVAPTLTGLQAAVAGMPVDATTGTQELPYTDRGSAFARDTAAYPLTTVQYAMLPTAGLAAPKAAAVARFVRQVTDPGGGQVYGTAPGRLAIGYASLTDAQAAQARQAAEHVAAQDGALPGNQSAGGSGSSGSTGGAGTTGGSSGGSVGGSSLTGGAAGSAGGSGATPVAAASSAAPGTAGGAAGGTVSAAAGRPSPDRAGATRYLLPVALVAGGVLLLGGPAVLLLGGTAAGGRVTAAARRRWNRLTGSGG
ncbi:hypothetical protein [Kitasatospora sp. NBC_01539]|uniref:hypothetical protein n=1 Tax=Kitasatospora sp. NBC_01539 TaxID=2903577 RepID=UPI0038601B92